ncbi:hypothetical protein [Endozoicomonas sp. 4G]|uniref:hypothetical protein n=1 Tax=Endozoicomonas sp. 4G TaxID=2872754 RepID=UPI00207870B7|nr:hypothetical protein [Endozoicomonas sp. 4G]
MNNIAIRLTLILFLTALSLAASGNIETLINVNENPVGTAISSQGIPHLSKAQTHLLVQQDSYTIVRQVLDSLSTSASFVVILFLPYYMVTAGDVFLKQQSGAHSYITNFFTASAVTVESLIRTSFTLLNLNFYFNYLTTTVSDYVDRENKILACDANLPRKGFMPVYPEHPWLASHYYQQVVFPEDQKPFLEINVLSNNDDIDLPDDIPEWAHLYQTLSDNRVDKLTVQIQDNNNLLKLRISGDQFFEDINLPVDTEADIQWDLQTLTTLCSQFEDDKVYSLFHVETLKAINRTIENSVSGGITEGVVFSPSFTDVLKSDKGAAVISLGSRQNNPVSRLVYSDHDVFTHHPGFLLLTDSSQHSEDLFSLALSTTSDNLAMAISSQKIWRQDHINDLMSLLRMGAGHLLYHAMNAHLAMSSNPESASSPQQSDSFKNSLSNVPESTELSERSVEPGFLRALTHTFEKRIKAGQLSLDNELYKLHMRFLSSFAMFMLEPSADGANPSVVGEKAVDENIKYGDKFIKVDHVFDENLLKKVNEEIGKDRRLFDVDFIGSEFEKKYISSCFENLESEYLSLDLPKNDVFDFMSIGLVKKNLRSIIQMHPVGEILISHFDKDGKIKEKEAFKEKIIHTSSESVKELCCQALEKMAASLGWSDNEVEKIQFYIVRYPLINPDRFKGFSWAPENIKGLVWHRDPGRTSMVVQLNDNDCEMKYSGGGLDIGRSSTPGYSVSSPDEGTKETHFYEQNSGFVFTNLEDLVHRGGDIDYECSNNENEVGEKCVIIVLAGNSPATARLLP